VTIFIEVEKHFWN